METPPRTVRITLFLILLNAVVWLGFAFLAVLGVIPGLPEIPGLRWLMAGLALACSIVLGLTAFLLQRRVRLGLVLGLLLLTIIAVLSLSDQLGWLDILSFLVCLVPLVLLVKDREWYLRSAGQM